MIMKLSYRDPLLQYVINFYRFVFCNCWVNFLRLLTHPSSRTGKKNKCNLQGSIQLIKYTRDKV